MPLFEVHGVAQTVRQVVCSQLVIHYFVDVLEVLVRQERTVVLGNPA